MEYHMLYVKNRKSFKVRREKKFIILPRATKDTRQRHLFAVCHPLAHGKDDCLPCPLGAAHGKTIG